MLIRIILTLCLSLSSATLWAKPPAWHKIAPPSQKVTSVSTLARQQHDLFLYFLRESLTGQGKTDFYNVSNRVANNIQWKNNKNLNIYNEAFKRSFEFMKSMKLDNMPPTIMLIPYLESQWDGKKGTPDSDYGYWQFVPEVIEEIRQLNYMPSALRSSSINQIRESAHLSTKAAKAHLHRYYFYFAKVAKYPEHEAWLFTLVAYNWGAGNIKRLMVEIEKEGLKPNFSNFYHRLYTMQRKNPKDISLRAAVEYVPNLWNIAKLLEQEN